MHIKPAVRDTEEDPTVSFFTVKPVKSGKILCFNANSIIAKCT